MNKIYIKFRFIENFRFWILGTTFFSNFYELNDLKL